MGQKQSYEVSREANAVVPVYRESAEDDIKMRKAARNEEAAPVISVPVHVHSVEAEDSSPLRHGEAPEVREILHRIEPMGEAEVHNIIITDGPKELVEAS